MNTLATIMKDAGTPIAISIVMIVALMVANRIIDAWTRNVQVRNDGEKQRSDMLQTLQSETIKASSTAFERAINVFVTRVEGMEREIRELKVDNDRKSRRVEEQDREIAELRAKVNSQASEITDLTEKVELQQKQLTEATRKMGEDGSEKKTRSRRTAA